MTPGTPVYSRPEFVARIGAAVRRARREGAGQLRFDGLHIDVVAREVLVGGRAVTLTAREFDVLAFLASHPRRVFTRAQLLTLVWNSSADWQDPDTVTELVRRIRNKPGSAVQEVQNE